MASFLEAFEKTIENEGGYKVHFDKDDPGELTVAGVTMKYHPLWFGWKVLDSEGANSVLLYQAVKSFYRKNFWDKMKGYKIENQKVAESIFDFSVNAGIYGAVSIAQKIIKTKVDGLIGPVTLGILNDYDSEKFLAVYGIAKIKHYLKLIDNNKKLKKFLRGWINRVVKGVPNVQFFQST